MLYGAIIGDICGSMYEGTFPIDIEDVSLFSEGSTFTDDTVCTCAIANALLTDGDFAKSLRDICNRHPNRGYGPAFRQWFTNPNIGMLNSYGNGAIMRVSPIAWAYDKINDILITAEASVRNSHNHPESIKAARAISNAIYLARTGKSKEEIIDNLKIVYDYEPAEINDIYNLLDCSGFAPICQESMPIVIKVFEESNTFEECIINAIFYGGDTDTNAAIVGSIAEAYYGISQDLIDKARSYLTPDLLAIVDKFESTFSQKLQSI